MVAVLLAPGIPVFVDVGLRAFLEGLRLLCRFRGLCLLPGDPFLLDQVDAGTDLQARGIAEQSCLLQGNILEGAEAVPALLAFKSVSIAPIFRPWARNDQIEAIAIGILAGLLFAFDIKWFQSAWHCFLRSKPSSEPTGKNHGLRSDWREHWRTRKYSVPKQTADFVVNSERRRTRENSILAEGVGCDLTLKLLIFFGKLVKWIAAKSRPLPWQ